MSLDVLAEQQQFQRTAPFFNAELINRYTKYVKSVGKRVIEVEFSWFQAKPCQSLHLRLTEKQFLDGKKYIRSKKLLNMSFEQFTDLLTPVVACNAAEITDSILRSTFDCLFDQDSNGTIEQEEFQSLLILLNTFNSKADSERKSFINEILQETFSRRHNHLTFKEFCDFVKSGRVREILMA